MPCKEIMLVHIERNNQKKMPKNTQNNCIKDKEQVLKMKVKFTRFRTYTEDCESRKQLLFGRNLNNYEL